MTDPAKKDPARAWRYAEKLLDEEDDARLAKMTDEEVFAEFDWEFGAPTGREPTADQMIAKEAAGVAGTRTELGTAVGPHDVSGARGARVRGRG